MRAPAGPLDERGERALDRGGIGVVGVVDEHAAVAPLELLPAQRRELDRSRACAQTPPAAGPRGHTPPRRRRDWRRDAPRAAARPARRARRARPARARVPPTSGLPGQATHVAGGLAERGRAQVSAPVGREQRLVDGHDGLAAGGQRRQQRGLLARDALEIAQELQMLGRDVRDHADVGLGDGGEIGQLADLARAQLADAQRVPRLEPEQRQRQAKAVVVVAMGCECRHVRGAERGEHVLRGRLAIRSGDADHLPAPRTTHLTGDGPERPQRLVGLQHADPFERAASGPSGRARRRLRRPRPRPGSRARRRARPRARRTTLPAPRSASR